MWPFKKTQLARPEEFPAVIDTLSEKLRMRGFNAEADRLDYLTHEFVATTSNELYAELRSALAKIRKEGGDFRPEIASELRRLIKSIDHICRWR
jgi:hypothetical protein